MLPDFRLYYKATVVKKSSVLAQKTKNQHIYSELTFDRGKNIQWGKIITLMWC